MSVWRTWNLRSPAYSFWWNMLAAKHTREQIDSTTAMLLLVAYAEVIRRNVRDYAYDVMPGVEYDPFWLSVSFGEMGMAPQLGKKAAKWFIVAAPRQARIQAAAETERLLPKVRQDIQREYGVFIP